MSAARKPQLVRVDAGPDAGEAARIAGQLDTAEHAEVVEVLAAPPVAGEHFTKVVARANAIVWLSERGLACEWPQASAPATLKLVEAPKPDPALSQGNPRANLMPVAPAVNHAAEVGVLVAALADNSLLDGPLSEVRADHLHDRTRREVFEAMYEIHGAGQAFDSAVLLDALAVHRAGPAAAALVQHLLQQPFRPELVERHAEIVLRDAEARAARAAAEALLRDSSGPLTRPGELADRVRGLIERVGLSQEDHADEFGFRSWPEPLGAAAWHGVSGDLVQEIAPLTEADPVAILAQLLACYGNVIGRSAHWSVDATRHYCNLFVVIAGQSSRGRKGTAWEIVKRLLGFLDPAWATNCVQSGLNSGEGLVESVRDPAVSKEQEFDPGVEDKRSIWVESEFSATIGVMNREGNSLSGYLRKAWDGDNLRSATKNKPVKATGPHVSVIGHTTFAELAKRLSVTESLNGFANRFLWVCARRSNELPEGGGLLNLDLDRHRNRLSRTLAFVRKRGHEEVPFDAKARELWHSIYGEISRPRAGRLGPITDRAEAQTRRLAVVYASLDRSPVVCRPHLEAALEFWAYCERSAAYIFGDAANDSAAEKVVEGLRKAGDKGLSKNEINRTLFRGKGASKVDGCLSSLIGAGLVEVRYEKNGRAKASVFVLSGPRKKGDPARSLRSSTSDNPKSDASKA